MSFLDRFFERKAAKRVLAQVLDVLARHVDVGAVVEVDPVDARIVVDQMIHADLASEFGHAKAGGQKPCAGGGACRSLLLTRPLTGLSAKTYHFL